jgi:hypothetical protein
LGSKSILLPKPGPIVRKMQQTAATGDPVKTPINTGDSAIFGDPYGDE